MRINYDWDEYTSGWDSDPSVKEYAAKVFLELSKKVELSALSVLDFGCGTGSLTEIINQKVKTSSLSTLHQKALPFKIKQ